MTELQPGKTLDVKLEHEMKRSYINYAMSVIMSRALPDVRDGLKPVHRRILFAMNDLSNTPDKPHKKSARIVGEVIGKYHPHGDQAVYDSMVHLAQDFSMRAPLVDGHGNFGSLDGDPAAAPRYTEARLSRIAMEMLRDIDKKTVDMSPNFDETLEEPLVLPARYPNLLVNGSSGIAVGMATNIPPHNMGEVIDGTIALMRNPDMTIDELRKIIVAPDFPTGGLIIGEEGVISAYNTGRGSVRMRARTKIERMQNGKTRIVVTELPFQVNKASMVQRIADLVRERKIDGITDLRDESDREGIRVVIENRRDADPNVILNQLFKHSQLEQTFGVNMLALVDGQPRLLSIREMLLYYIDHQRVVVTRRTQFDLDKAEARAHILEGLIIALDNIDEVVSIIRSSRDTDLARKRLMDRFGLSEKQAQAILDMRLARLTGLERQNLEDEYKEVQATIERLKGILADPKVLDGVIITEMEDIKKRFADDRRTEVVQQVPEDRIEDLIAEEDVVITFSHEGYVKRVVLDTYRGQKRGGRGVTAMGTKEEDFVENVYVATTHHQLMVFTDKGRVYKLRVHEIPESGRAARGIPIINLVSLAPDENINAVIPVKTFDSDHSLVMVTKGGLIKRTQLSEFSTNRSGGLIAISLRDDDALVSVRLAKDNQEEIIIGTKEGKAIRFGVSDVRPMGRTAQGVKAIALRHGDEVVGMDVPQAGADVLVLTETGFGKRTSVDEFRKQTRGGSGIILNRVSDKTGVIVTIRTVQNDDEFIVITSNGVLIRLAAADVSQQGRATNGVHVIRLDEGDKAVAVARIDSSSPIQI
jgi:DNA gyrase subunit A